MQTDTVRNSTAQDNMQKKKQPFNCEFRAIISIDSSNDNQVCLSQ